MNKSFFYAICFVVILVVEIIIGIYVRDSFVRPYMGDALVVVLIYCFIRIFIPNGLSQLPLYVLACLFHRDTSIFSVGGCVGNIESYTPYSPWFYFRFERYGQLCRRICIYSTGRIFFR